MRVPCRLSREHKGTPGTPLQSAPSSSVDLAIRDRFGTTLSPGAATPLRRSSGAGGVREPSPAQCPDPTLRASGKRDNPHAPIQSDARRLAPGRPGEDRDRVRPGGGTTSALASSGDVPGRNGVPTTWTVIVVPMPGIAFADARGARLRGAAPIRWTGVGVGLGIDGPLARSSEPACRRASIPVLPRAGNPATREAK